MINARSETLLERPSYRGLAKSSNGRCLVVADGFYEWQGVKGGPKQPWRFTVDGGEPFCFAGLHTTWVPEQGGLKLRSCTIITTTPNELVKPVHDRMPAILADPADLEAWLDPDLDGTEASGLLRPFDASRMSADRVARAVGKPGNEGPSLLIPEQEGLF
jgi:putative SOS response-associated peptidase YedK